jgi:hypothetical protein
MELVTLWMLTVGKGTTVSNLLMELVQVPLLPTIVYVVDDEGLTAAIDPVNVPGCQVYVDAPEALSVAVLPKQTVGVAGVIVIAGTGNTIGATV